MLWMALPIMFLAGLVHGTFGIGFPLIATPLLALFTDVRTAVIITLLPTISVNVSILLSSGNLRAGLGPHWRVLPYVLIGAGAGSLVLTLVDPRPFLLLLAGALLLYLNQHRLSVLDLSWIRRQPGIAYAFFGLTGGFMAGTVNVMIPVLIILAMELGIARIPMMQLFNLNFLSAKLVQIMVFFHAGQLTQEGILSTLPLIPAALAALLVGMWLRRRISEAQYRSVLRAVLWLMAAVLVIRFALQ